MRRRARSGGARDFTRYVIRELPRPPRADSAALAGLRELALQDAPSARAGGCAAGGSETWRCCRDFCVRGMYFERTANALFILHRWLSRLRRREQLALAGGKTHPTLSRSELTLWKL